MEVMNRAELTQNDILVGQKATTRSFGVSDDPMLMSMLSTGFYQNPLRTMIQEVMFNAWDAHRMGNCQHRPIDIYINDTTGLIIRDYGPGIEPGEDDDNMHEIYCMYGGSTKRKLKNQTGGFGLGSKSPFAYTESFTVTSHFGGMKNMYLISRVSDANGGKPGMTPLVRVPTTETGLMVTVPLKAVHIEKAYEHVKDILYLSGIKAMIHFMDEPDEFIDSESVTIGQYKIDMERTGGKIYAVYGGVRYLIPRDDHYESEYNFMKLLAKSHDVFVGFAPDTLSPLPNREGLNMGEKSKDNVKAAFELCMEKFNGIFDVLADTFFEVVMEHLRDAQYQHHFAFVMAIQYGPNHNAQNNRRDFSEAMQKKMPAGSNPDVWKIASDLIIHQTNEIMKMLKVDTWKTKFIKNYIAVFPEGKALGFAALKAQTRDVFPFSSRNVAQEFVQEFYGMSFLRDQENFLRAMKEQFPTDDALHPVMRVYQSDSWVPVHRDRGFANLSKTKHGVRKLNENDPRLARKPARANSLQDIYLKKEGTSVGFLMMNKTVLLAKTATALNDTSIPAHVHQHRTVIKGNHYYYDGISMPIPAYIVHERKGGYAKALELLTNAGFNVIEGVDPERKVYVPKAKTVMTYSPMQPRNSDFWANREADKQITDPTHFFYATLATIRGYSSGERPDYDLAYWFMKQNPKTVTVTNIKIAETLMKAGALSLPDGITKWYDEHSVDVDRMTNVIRASKIAELANLPEEMLRHPYIQLELGMEPVDPTDTDFWHESEGYRIISGANYYPLRDLKKRVRNQLDLLWIKDKEKKNIERMCELTKAFNNSFVSSLWSDSSPKKQDAVVDKIIAAMNLFK